MEKSIAHFPYPLRVMKKLLIVLLSWVGTQPIFAQEELLPKFYLGLSYGTSFSLGDFEDTDINNPDAGFAKNGRKLDVYGGIPLKKGFIFTAGFRYQAFETEVEDIIDRFKAENPGVEFTGSTEDWQTYYFLVGLAYRVRIGPRFNFYPRVGLGPLWATNPGIRVNAPNATITNNFERSSETGLGLGYELGIGLQTNIGRRLSLQPTFTVSGGRVTMNDVVTTTDNIRATNNYQPIIQSFNLGISLGYRFY